VRIYASLCAANPLHLGDAVARLEVAGVDGLHIDFADGRFTPVLQGGLDMVRAARAASQLPISVHLMAEDPERWMQPAVAAGAGRIAVHVEATAYPWRLRALARRLGVEFGLAFNPATPLTILEPLSEVPDFLSLLTTEPDEAGERFLPGMLARIRAARVALPAAVEIEVDGGIDARICMAAIAEGATDVVAGRALLGAADWTAAVAEFRASGLRGG
jgi:ribulose-phosphate 3-epimerase